MHRRMLTRRVAKIKIHLHYNSRTNDNDIALIKLSRPVKLSGRVRTREHNMRVIFPCQGGISLPALLRLHLGRERGGFSGRLPSQYL